MYLRCLMMLSAVTLCLVCVAEDSSAQEKKEREFNAYAMMFRANQLANAGSYTRAVPLYVEVLKREPESNSIAHFNLAEINKARGRCVAAAFHYQAYLLTGRDADSLRMARSGLKECLRPDAPTLEVRVEQPGAEVRVNGFLLSRGPLAPTQFPAGIYQVEVTATDHNTQSGEVNIKREAGVFVASLEKLTFFGELEIKVEQPGASIKIVPRELDKPDSTAPEKAGTSPMKAPVKLATGNYFIEVNLDGYNRWVRNVRVSRDATNQVEVKLNKALPEEIR
jgi:tetratricopeptide (TPR) repeat protein